MTYLKFKVLISLQNRRQHYSFLYIIFFSIYTFYIFSRLTYFTFLSLLSSSRKEGRPTALLSSNTPPRCNFVAS